MIERNKKADSNLMWVLISIVIILAIAIISFMLIRQSSDVGMSAWQKIKDLNPFT